jgi:hypothetical protein
MHISPRKLITVLLLAAAIFAAAFRTLPPPGNPAYSTFDNPSMGVY